MSATCTAGDEMELRQFRLIADKIEADPSLLAIPLANIERWLGHGQAGKHELESWRELILAARKSPVAFQRLLGLLRSDDDEALEWKGHAPFPGILTPVELERTAWIFRH